VVPLPAGAGDDGAGHIVRSETAVSGTTLLLTILAVLSLAAILAITRRRPVTRRDDDGWPEVDVVVDLEFLRSRPAELDQRISELVALSGGATLGARMRSVQASTEQPVPKPTRVRRRTRPLVAPR
jgi:hypothetical protein